MKYPYPDTRKSVGKNGENKACDWLSSHGYEIIARNWKTKTGEIDIIAAIDNTIVFVEVKALPSGNLETLSHELDGRKQKRIVETAKYFILNNRKYSNCYIRFDVVVVDMPALPEVYHIENAFSEFS